jgi:hypothetical protein
MTTPMAAEHLFAGDADLQGSVEPERGLRDHDLVVERIALAGEATAVRSGDHLDVGASAIHCWPTFISS